MMMSQTQKYSFRSQLSQEELSQSQTMFCSLQEIHVKIINHLKTKTLSFL